MKDWVDRLPPLEGAIYQAALRSLQTMLGEHAAFRPGQWEAIRAVVAERRRVLVVQRTGWGKSLVYFIATHLLRSQGNGPTLVISPLLALMRNQQEMAQRIGLRALSINSANPDEWDAIESALREDQCDLLLVSPERLANERFQREVVPSIPRGIGLFVVDEAHCISDWGHDFRPDYRRIVRLVQSLPRSVPVLATTATANARVVADVAEQLGPGLEVMRGPLSRDSLRLQVIRLLDQAERLAWLAENLPRLPGSGIVYCLTIADTRRVGRWLRLQGLDVAEYHSEVPADERSLLEERLLQNDIKALVATVALGMGFDKPDLGFVVHYQRPGSVVEYYQQIGRAGRAVEEAYAVLLNGREDDEIRDYFIRTAFPTAEEMSEVLEAIESVDDISLDELLSLVNLPRGRVQQCLKMLEVDGAIVYEGKRYKRTLNPWQPDVERSRRVTQHRYDELDRMRAFVDHDGCLMEFVRRELDDPNAAPCGRCAGCVGPMLPTRPSPSLVEKARAFLRHDFQIIEPRKQWPPGGVVGLRGRIPPHLQNAQGVALSLYGDAGWGREVVRGKYELGRFSDELVAASAHLVRDVWHPDPFPEWVTAVPSHRHPTLVDDLARRLAEALGLPYRRALCKVRETREQKTMLNWVQQATNVAGAFAAVPGQVLPGPVLLVDDVVDSRWTLTWCGYVLRKAGSGIVYPYALAVATTAGDSQ